ncbi:hypothetical protein VSR34_29820 [Paraburkholderia sp. JHI2823]|uniref:hypothetical protein n=1 Tax=Paraburkholderia sp. JHI2823 TaxID=3112960 RepID=UPI00316FDB47
MLKKLFDRDTKLAAHTLVFMLYGVVPMFVFGWLLATIARHPEAVAALQDEYAYRYTMYWLGGEKWLPLLLGATAFGSLFCGAEYLARAALRYAEPKFMPAVRTKVQEWTLKPFVSALAFVDGLLIDDIRACIAVFILGVVLAFWSLHLLKVSES